MARFGWPLQRAALSPEEGGNSAMLHPAISTSVAQTQVGSEAGRIPALYASARSRGQRGQFWSSLTGRSRCLFRLASINASCGLENNCDAGLRTVPIAQILGSEGRSTDFDCDFCPLQDHNRERWLGIATARQQGRALPPVALVQIGDIYFVRDGHHRISVARVLGQESIKAKVAIWQATGPLPWETAAPAGQYTGAAGALDRIQGTWARLAVRTG
jgi:hypothetical protein